MDAHFKQEEATEVVVVAVKDEPIEEQPSIIEIPTPVKEDSKEPGEVKDDNDEAKTPMATVASEFTELQENRTLINNIEEPIYPCAENRRIKSLLNRTGYQLEITGGQRKYGGPPPNFEGRKSPSGVGYEIYIGHIPPDVFEDILVPLFEQCGKIWEMRLMMEPKSLRNRGYAFLTYFDSMSASAAAQRFNNYEIIHGKFIKVNVSVANTRLFLGNIPKSRTKEEIIETLRSHAEGVTDVILHTIPDATERNKNRGFCFVDFVDHRCASDARRKISQQKIRPFNTDLVVDWAEQQEEPDEETMRKVKVLYVRNLKEAVTENMLKDIFGAFGQLEKIKRIKDYAFVHFKERESCIKAMQEMNRQVLEGLAIDCSLAKPQTEDRRRKTLYPIINQRGRGGERNISRNSYGQADVRGYNGRPARGRGSNQYSSNYGYQSPYAGFRRPDYDMSGGQYGGYGQFEEGNFEFENRQVGSTYPPLAYEEGYGAVLDYSQVLSQVPPPPPPPPSQVLGSHGMPNYGRGMGHGMYGARDFNPSRGFRGSTRGKRPAGQSGGPAPKRDGHSEFSMAAYGYRE